MDNTSESWPPRLVASTGNAYNGSIIESHIKEQKALNGNLGNGTKYKEVLTSNAAQNDSNVFRSIEWTPDGTSLVAITEDNCARTFIVPPDLLTSAEPHKLLPYSITCLPSTPYSTSIYPFFNLTAPETTLILTSTPSHPIQLRSLLYPYISASYPLIHTETETYLTPASLLWTSHGTHFLAGTDSQIHLFDVSRSNEGPVTSYITGKKRKKLDAKSLSDLNVRGIVSAMCLHPTDGALAAGTYTRQVLLYSSPYQDAEIVGSINLTQPKSRSKKGNGVTHMSFNSSGTHLFIAERKSDVVSIYDLRNPSKAYGYLLGRRGDTNQKLGFSIGAFREKNDMVFAGGTDGVVRVYDPISGSTDTEEGQHSPIMEWKAAEDPVTSAALHPTGSVIATSSGERKLKNQKEKEWDSDSDNNNLQGSETTDNKIWDNGISIWAF